MLLPVISVLLVVSNAIVAYEPRTDLEGGRYLKTYAEAEAQIQRNPNNALAWAAKAQALLAFQRVPEALAAAERAVSLNESLADALLARGMARGGQAVQQRNLSSIQGISGALDDLERATKADPKLISAWMVLGLAYQQLPGLLGGSTRKALACADNLRKVNPAKGDLLQGIVLSMDERWNEASPFFKRALSLASGDPEIIFGYLDALGSRETRRAIGNAEQKRRLAAEAHRLAPLAKAKARSVEAVSLALLDADLPEEAWRLAKDALDQVDAPSLLRLQLGKIAARSGLHRDEGLAFLDRVIREPLEGGSGGIPAAQWRRGQILKDLGRKEEARAAAEAALKLDPKHAGARKLLESL
jgi:tetratricopeptide (TPR) repeat protein